MNPLTQSIMALVQDTSLTLPHLTERIEALVAPVAQPQGAVDAEAIVKCILRLEEMTTSNQPAHRTTDPLDGRMEHYTHMLTTAIKAYAARQTEAANAVIAELLEQLDEAVKEDSPVKHPITGDLVRTAWYRSALEALTRARAYQSGQPDVAPKPQDQLNTQGLEGDHQCNPLKAAAPAGEVE